MVFAEVEVNIRALGEPEGSVLLGKRDGPVFHDFVFREKSDFGHGLDHLGFYAHDLEGVGGDPCPSFQVNGINLSADFIAVNAVGAVFALAEVDKPCGPPVPVPEAFAGHDEVAAHVRMEDERENSKAGAGNIVRIFRRADFVGAVFIDREKSGLRFGDRSDVVVLAGFGANGDAEFVKGLMH